VLGAGGAAALCLVVVLAVRQGVAGGMAPIDADFGTVKTVGRLLFTQYLLPFQATSLLLLGPLLGAGVGGQERVQPPRDRPMVPVNYYLALAAVLFALGLAGVILKRNALIVFMCVELMLNGANLTFLAFARANGTLSGHAIAFFVIAVAAAEAAVGLAIVIAVFRTRGTVNVDELTELKG